MLIIEYVKKLHEEKDPEKRDIIRVPIRLVLSSFKFYRKNNVRRLSMLIKN